MKLTKEYRNQIIERCVTARFAEAEERYEAARTVLADALYEHAFGEGEALAKKLPPVWCTTMNTVHIGHPDFNGRYYKDDTRPSNGLKLSGGRLQPAIITRQFEVSDDHPLRPQADQVARMFSAIKTGKGELTTQLTSLLYSIGTREKLMEVWPEGEPFFPPVAEKGAVPIPYDLTLQINRMMGIGAVQAVSA